MLPKDTAIISKYGGEPSANGTSQLKDDDCNKCVLDYNETQANETENESSSDQSAQTGSNITSQTSELPEQPEQSASPEQLGLPEANETNENNENRMDSFAQCLTSRGAKIYIKTGCGYCDQQRKLFGESFKYLNVFNCTEHMETCLELKLKNTPTWIFKGGSQLVGSQELAALSDATGCVMP